MKTQTELLLYRLLWAGGTSFSPDSTLNPNSLPEGASLNSSMLRQVQRLEKRQLVQREKKEHYGRLLKLTKQGEQILSDELWTSRWETVWNGSWTIVLFNIAEKDRGRRDDFRRRLMRLRFGCLQRSLWISPFPQPELIQSLQKDKPPCGHCTLMQAKEFPGLAATSLVKTSWNFNLLEERQTGWGKSLKAIEQLLSSPKAKTQDWNKALENEFHAWQKVRAIDPFLPLNLQPNTYGTPKLHRWKQELMKQSQQLNLFRQ